MEQKKRVHIVSPSGVVDRQYVIGAQMALQHHGFEVTLAPHVFEQHGRFAGTPEQRVNDINAALANKDIDILLCSRGGYGMAQIIDKIVIPEEHCPLVVGFSDITCLHNLLGTRDISSLHGLMTKHLTVGSQASQDAFYSLLDGQDVRYTLPPHRLNRWGKAQGLLRGGNLSVLYGLQGTPYAVQKGGILFIEDIAERHYHIDRMMQNLRMSGVLASLSGLIVGQFTDCDDDPLMGQTVQETILQAVAEYDYPVAFNFPAGHDDYNLSLLMNHPCCLTVENDKVLVEQKGIKI